MSVIEEADLVLQHLRRRKVTPDEACVVCADVIASMIADSIQIGASTHEDATQAIEALRGRIRAGAGLDSRGVPGDQNPHHE